MPRPDQLERAALFVHTGAALSPEHLAGWLADNFFESVDSVDMPGQFARRGGIVDVYAPVASVGQSQDDLGQPEAASVSRPVRIEFFGDQVESIRRIDLDTQRSAESIESLGILPPIGAAMAGGRTSYGSAVNRIDDNDREMSKRDYYATVRRSILEKFREYDFSDFEDEEDIVKIDFELLSNGSPKGMPQFLGTENQELKDLLTRCFENATPFPPFPENLGKESQRFSLGISFKKK